MDNPGEMHAWRITTAPGGWLRLRRRRLVEGEVVEEPGAQHTIYLRVAKGPDGRLGVRDAVMIGGETITSTSWREIPFDMAGVFASALGSGPDAPPAFEGINESLDGEATGRFSLLDSLESLFSEGAVSTVLIPGVGAPSGSLATLKAPDGPLTDDFLSSVAAAYGELSAAKRAPGPAIAEQTGAPVRTVHGWIAEARKRGHLPPARRGKAG